MPFKGKFFISIYLHLRVYHEHMFVSIVFRTNVLFFGAIKLTLEK
nr:MAG TPA: hypothetical protein [Bacteriophage sp.]